MSVQPLEQILNRFCRREPGCGSAYQAHSKDEIGVSVLCSYAISSEVFKICLMFMFVGVIQQIHDQNFLVCYLLVDTARFSTTRQQAKTQPWSQQVYALKANWKFPPPCTASFLPCTGHPIICCNMQQARELASAALNPGCAEPSCLPPADKLK